jgi:uncharacterized protein (DUF433 family)
LTARGLRFTGLRYSTSRGNKPKKILQSYPHLKLSQIYTALAYFHAHRDEIDRELADQDAEYEELKQQLPT